MQADILIKDCTLLQGDNTFLKDAYVAIKDTKIAFVGTGAQWQQEDHTAVQTLDGTDKLLMPGLIDGHTHTCQQLLRGRVANEYPMVWTRILVPFESNLDPEDSYYSGLLACMEMIKSGTTAFCDAGGVHMERVCDAVLESGMRAAITRSTMDVAAGIVASMREPFDVCIRRNEELYRAYQGKGDGRLDIWFGIRQILNCSEGLIRQIGEKAREYHTRVHMHFCEHRDEVAFCLKNYQRRPSQYMEMLGVWGPDLVTAHNVLLTDQDISLMAKAGVKAVHCPRANLTSHGFPRTPTMFNSGVSVGLGCDGAGANNLCLFEEMQVLRYALIAYWGLPYFDPVAVDSMQLLNMAIRGGAAAIGHADTLGEISVGKTADVILVNIMQPHLYPTIDLVRTITDSMGGRDVTDSIINGKLVMKDRQLLTIDEEKVLAECARRMKAIFSRAQI